MRARLSPDHADSGIPASPASRGRDRWASFAICLILALTVWAVFGQTRNFQFVNFDDDRCVYENPAITRGLDARAVVWAFTHTLNDNWLPLTALSHMLDCQLHHLNPGGHHLTNVLLHAATAMLLFLMLRNLTGAFWRSAFVAAVFALHPLRVESVAWVSERKDALSGLFFVLTLWAYGVHARRQSDVNANDRSSYRSPFYWLALTFFILGLLSKPMLVTLPFVLLLLDFWPLKRFSIRRTWLRLFLEKIPFLGLSAAACVATILAQRNATVSFQAFDFSTRLGNALTAYVVYIRQMFYPVGLTAFYPHPGNQLSYRTVAASALILLLISVGVIVGRKNRPYLLVGWLWYLGMLVPVIGLMQVGGQAWADRYTYLPQIGLYLLLAWGVVDLCSRSPRHRAILGFAAVAILAGLLATAYVQTGYWKNSVSLWTHALDCGAESPFAQNNLGSALVSEGELPAAIAHYELALQLKPDYAEARNNLGLALAAEGKLPEAAREYEQALQLNPDNPQVLFNLGNILAATGKLSEAAQYYEHAVHLKPDYIAALYNLGNALAAQGKLPEAAQHFEQVTKLKPDYAEAWNNLGNTLTRQGQVPEGIRCYQRTLELNPDYVEALNNLGNAFSSQKRWREAVQSYERAHQLKPDGIETLYNLGVALAAEQKMPEAIQRLREALDLATARNQPELAGIIRRRLDAYQSAQPLFTP